MKSYFMCMRLFVNCHFHGYVTGGSTLMVSDNSFPYQNSKYVIL